LQTGFLQNNTQVEQFSFGNPNLAPETAETTTYGVVLQPEWFPIGDLRATIDYYHIEITNVISGFGAQFWINQCYHAGSLPACARVVRDPVTGQLDFVNASTANSALFETEGWDLQFEWSVPFGPGQLTINELYSMLNSWIFDLEPGLPPAPADFAGTSSAGIGGAFPEYKSVLSVTYNVGDWTFFGRWSYVPEVVSGNGFGGFFGGSVSPAASYVDMSARWNVTDNFTLTANIDNVSDEQPPQTPDGTFGGQGNTDPQIYRVLGRTFALSGRYRF
jgi:outer membrane receptor protein involved in Fe transport